MCIRDRIGGEVRVGGKNNLNRPWSIGIETPIKNTLPGEQIFGKVDISNKGMATSGNYRNFYTYNGKSYSHIIDPRNGKSVESSLLSVTVTEYVPFTANRVVWFA